jgi:hypothetical protein
VGQNSDPNRGKEFSPGNKFLLAPSPVGKSLGNVQKRLRKTK